MPGNKIPDILLQAPAVACAQGCQDASSSVILPLTIAFHLQSPSLLFQPSHHRCQDPRRGAGCHLNHRQRSPAGTVCITGTAQTGIHSCPGSAMTHSEWSCQKKIGLCRVWHLYLSWEHVAVPGTHTADNMTNFSSFVRHWGKVWKLCWRQLPALPSWIRSLRQGAKSAHNLQPPLETFLHAPRTRRPAPIPPQFIVQWTSFALQSRLSHKQSPSRLVHVEANTTQPQGPPGPLKPEAEGLSKQQIWSSFHNPSPARLSLMLKSVMCSDTKSPLYLLSGPRLSRARAGWLVLHKSCSDLSITRQHSQHSSALTAIKWARIRTCLLVTLITTAAVSVNLQSSTSFTFIYHKNIKPSLGVMQFVRKSLN